MKQQARSRPARGLPVALLCTLLLPLLLLLLPSCSALHLHSDSYPYPSDHLLPRGVFLHTFALFGPEPETFNVTNSLWHDESNPSFCGDSAPSKEDVSGRIILARRDSRCDFLTRALKAEKAGAAALIIGDNKPSSSFDTQFMGPYSRERPLVHIPVILITGNTYHELISGSPSHWRDTTATIDVRGLFADFDTYEAMYGGSPRFAPYVRVIFNLMPFAMVIVCYYSFYKTWTPPSRRQQQRQGQGQQQQAQQPGQQAAAGQQAEGEAQPAPAAPPHAPHPASFSEQEMSELSLPVPPHLSSSGEPDSAQLSEVSLDVGEGDGLGDGRQRSGSVDDAEHKENVGLMAAGSVASDQPARGRASGASSLRQDAPAQFLHRPLLPAPSIALHIRLYFHLLKLLAALGKPRAILRVNLLVYLLHAASALTVLVVAWNESCVNENLAMVSLWCARALIGARIAYWQTHSASAPPICPDVFMKNWADAIFLFTGSMFSWSEAQKADCATNAPTIYAAVRFWTLCIYVTYGLRVLLWLADRAIQRRGPDAVQLPHVLSIGVRSLLSQLNAGFSCAGALDKNQPATQLDLMLIPTVQFRDGMYAPDDALCGVCLGEYAPGETLRILNCSHHYHQACVDTWLLQKNSCPICRTSIDDSRGDDREDADADDAIPREDLERMERQQEASRPPQQAQRPPSPSQAGRAGPLHEV